MPPKLHHTKEQIITFLNQQFYKEISPKEISIYGRPVVLNPSDDFEADDGPVIRYVLVLGNYSWEHAKRISLQLKDSVVHCYSEGELLAIGPNTKNYFKAVRDRYLLLASVKTNDCSVIIYQNNPDQLEFMWQDNKEYVPNAECN